MTTTPVLHEADELLLGFTRALRSAGVPVTSDRAQTFLHAAALVGLDDERAAYVAGRATLCAGPDDLTRFDRVWHAWFSAHLGLPEPRPAAPPSQPRPDMLPDDEVDAEGEGSTADRHLARASAVEVLRHRDVAALDPHERARLALMFASLHPAAPTRRAARHRRWHRGRVDADRTLRESLRRMGEPGRVAWRRPAERQRRVVLLVDVSGSMSGYADALLRLANRFCVEVPTAEAFTVGTRLTHVTRALRLRDPARAIAAAGETVPDWSGGTRLGESLRVFLDRWGRRGMARGAVVVVFSDGWERGDTGLLADQMQGLRRVAHRVVWVNPHRGKAGYEPVQSGIAAALPFVDDFLAGHSLATFAELVEVVARA